jgi:WD40 repeat protein
MFTSGPSVLTSTSQHAEDGRSYSFWDAHTRQKLPVEVRLSVGDSYRVARDADGRVLLLVSRAGQGAPAVPRLEAWDAVSGKLLSPPLRLADGVLAPQGSLYPGSFVCLLRAETVRGPAPLHWDGPICRWEPETGRLVATPWQPPVSTWYRIGAANDSLLVTHCRDGRARLFDLDAGRQLGGHLSVPSMHTPGPTSISLAVTSDGTTLATVGLDGTVRGWDLKHLTALSTRALHQAPSWFPPAAQGKGDKVVALSSGPGARAFFARGDVGQVVAVDSGQALGGPIEHDKLNGAVFSRDGAWLATATLASPRPEPPIVHIWDAVSGKLHFRFEAARYVHGLRFSPDGRLLAVACVRKTFVIDVARKKLRHVLEEASCAVNLCFSPDGRHLAVGYMGGWPGVGAGHRVWNLQTGQPAGPFRHGWSWWSASQPLGYAAGGDVLVVLDPDGRKVTRYDLRGEGASGAELDVQSPSKLAVCPSSPLVAVTNTSGAIELWNASSGQRHRTIPSGCEVRALHLSPDGEVLAAVCSDQTVRLWDMATGFPLGSPIYHPSPVAALAFLGGERGVVTATQSGRLFRWPGHSPMIGTAQDCERQLEARLGITFAGGDAVLLAPEDWQARRR